MHAHARAQDVEALREKRDALAQGLGLGPEDMGPLLQRNPRLLMSASATMLGNAGKLAHALKVDGLACVRPPFLCCSR